MALFKDKKNQSSSIPASAPDEEETPGEIKNTEEATDKKEPIQQYREVPVCLSRSQLDNINLETNMIVKEILAKAQDWWNI